MKSVCIRSFFVPYFPGFSISPYSFRMKKIRTRKINSKYGNFSHIVYFFVCTDLECKKDRYSLLMSPVDGTVVVHGGNFCMSRWLKRTHFRRNNLIYGSSILNGLESELGETPYPLLVAKLLKWSSPAIINNCFKINILDVIGFLV